MITTKIPGFEVAARQVEAGSSWGVALQRFVAPRDWPDALALITDSERRAAAEHYLREIARRMKVQRAVKSGGR